MLENTPQNCPDWNFSAKLTKYLNCNNLKTTQRITVDVWDFGNIFGHESTFVVVQHAKITIQYGTGGHLVILSNRNNSSVILPDFAENW